MGVADRLEYARKRTGLTLSQVKERSGIGESSLSEFENGRREPGLSQLQALATVYRRSIAFFLAEGSVSEEIVLWRERPKAGAEEVEARFLRLCECYHNLEVWTEETVPLWLPETDSGRATGGFGYANAEALAKKVRDELSLGDRPALALHSVLEEVCGVKVFHLDFEPSGTAASSRSETFGAAVLLNRANRRWRRNFDLAHEFFHILTWQVFRQDTKAGATSALPSPEEEKFATCFARNLLMPAETLRVAVHNKTREGKVTFETLFDIARQFDVSVEALIWQMKSVRLLQAPKSQANAAIERAKALAPILEERDEVTPSERPERFRALAIKSLRRGAISTGRFAEYLGISRREAMKYAEQETAQDEEVPVAPA